jgi:hypothetical protein
MTTREEVIDRWQSRLSETQSRTGESSLQGNWVRRVYARIYRFLLACYGAGDWKTEPADHSSASSTAALTVTPELAGKPPKREGQIGKVLKSLHGANTDSASTLPA